MAVSLRLFALCLLLGFMVFVSVNAVSSVEEKNVLQSLIDNSTMADRFEMSDRLDLQFNTNLKLELHRRNEDIAIEKNDSAVDEDPERVASMVDMNIRNSTERRKLGFLSCGTGNPIDDCWRCDRNWQRHRKRLADCAIGFGRNAIGGRDGRYYVVTDPNDDNPVHPRPGTLRHAVIQDQPLWIIFKRDMVITLKQELIMNSFKTIDARGVNVHIANGGCITIQYITNVIIHGLHIHDCKPTGNAMVRSSPSHYGWRTMADGDGISIFGSSHIWVDHNSLSNCADGLVDAIMGSTAITISNNYFTHHNEVTHRVQTTGRWRHWNWRSEGDLMLNGAFFVPSGTGAGASYARASSLSAKPSSVVASLTSGSGALVCRRGRQC
ncbi:AmbAllergen [Cynara cardunculus var. scolymus]|uniref:Pectate lyase n=1 Tax=Cynara cardunculus var. scolymus TaxID=59895 RepID=A0A118JVL8_CYNCS|nr:AmbAllergen [Cynara cardunculus var. scolymus]